MIAFSIASTASIPTSVISLSIYPVAITKIASPTKAV
jgi:hypothetical protein